MNKMISTVALLAIAGNVVMAGGDIAPVEPNIPEVVESDNGWKYAASLNLFMASIKGETSDGADIDISFRDIVENLDMAMMGTVAAQKGKWTLLTDVLYMDISQGIHAQIPGEPVVITDVEMKAWIVTPMVAYRIMEEENFTLNVLAGARYFYLKIPLEYSVPGYTPDGSTSKSGYIWDGIVGVRGQYRIDEKWYMPFQFDIGAGDSDVTGQAFAGVGYKYGEKVDVVAGYRYMHWEVDQEALKDLSFEGPMVGLKYYF